MADSNYTEATRSGANACLTMLRKMEASNEDEQRRNDSFTWENHWDYLQDITDRGVKASGVTDSFSVGFVASLIEFIEFVNSTGTPNLDAGGWIPKKAMTEAEFKTYQHSLESAGRDEEAQPQPQPA